MRSSRRTSRRRAFTLIELLVVITIIGVLMALVVGASTVVIKRQKVATTRSIVLTLDRAMEEYLAVSGNVAPPYVREYFEGVPGPFNRVVKDERTYAQHLIDNYPAGNEFDVDEHPHRPDSSVFIRQVSGQGEVDAILQEIPSRFLILTPGPDAADDPKNLYPSVVDAWKNDDWDAEDEWPAREQQLIYYVHPENFLAQAIYGQCRNQRPYFVSAGPDLKYAHPEELDELGLSVDTGGEDADWRGDDAQQQLLKWRSDNIYSHDIETDFGIQSDVAGMNFRGRG